MSFAEETPMRNEPLARKVFDHILAHPEEWNQAVWFADAEYVAYQTEEKKTQKWIVVPQLPACGTAACFAGTAALIDGADVQAKQGWNATADGKGVSTYAAEALGLTEREADWLFESDNTLDDIRSYLTSIYGGEW